MIDPNAHRRPDERLLEICTLPHPDYDAIDVFAPAKSNGRWDVREVPDYDEFLSNARLIAAAPELAEAAANALLEFKLLDLIVSCGDRDGGPWAILSERIQARINELDLVLAKIRGLNEIVK